jgi:hypothetical protein
MLEQVTESWWKLSFENDDGKVVFFGYTEKDVKNKFAAWFRKVKRKV